tara:strand:- start:377 stop:706 length:330 start_codon:yes stop_codon:yes gene_type:complete
MASEIHLNDIGTKFVITVKDGGETVDISNGNVSSRSIMFRKPSDTVVTKVGALDGDGSSTSGVMHYVTLPDDLDEVGFWKLQGKIEFDGVDATGTFYTDINTFQVHCNL